MSITALQQMAGIHRDKEQLVAHGVVSEQVSASQARAAWAPIRRILIHMVARYGQPIDVELSKQRGEWVGQVWTDDVYTSDTGAQRAVRRLEREVVDALDTKLPRAKGWSGKAVGVYEPAYRIGIMVYLSGLPGLSEGYDTGAPPGGWGDEDLVPVSQQRMSKRATRQAMEFGTRKSTRKGAQKKPRADKRKMTISRYNQKDFDIRVGDEVKVWFGKNKWQSMEVLGLSPQKKKVRVGSKGAVRKGGQWMDAAYIYPQDQKESLDEGVKRRRLDIDKSSLAQYKKWLERMSRRLPLVARELANWYRLDVPASAPGELNLEIYHLPLPGNRGEFNIVVADYGDRQSVELSVPQAYEEDEAILKLIQSRGREVWVDSREEAANQANMLAMIVAKLLRSRG